MSTVVCDASVLFKLLVEEPDSILAAKLLASSRVVVPELAYAEIGNAMWSCMRSGEISRASGEAALAAMAALQLDVRPIRPHVRRALAIATLVEHPIYDCIYLALAESLDIPVVTADRRFSAALRRANWQGVEVRALNSLA